MTANIANADRFVHYTPNNSTGPFPVPFPVFDPTGADLEVTLNGQVVTSGWSFTGTLEPGFYGAPNTWVNGSISFDAPISGSLYIEGNRAPRRPAEAQFAEGRGIPARDHNTEFNTLTAICRELFQRLRRTIRVPLGEQGLELPPIADRIGKYVGWDGNGNFIPLQPNEIHSGDIGDNAVISSKIADGAVTDPKVFDPPSPSHPDAVRASKLSFLQAGTDAVYRTVQDKLREFVSVKDFGAVGDGVTDDTAAFQAAAAYFGSGGSLFESNGGVLFVPKGLYKVTGQTLFQRTGVRIIGEGLDATKITVAADLGDAAVFKFDQILSYYSMVGAGVENLSIHMNGFTGHGVHMLKPYDGVSLRNLYVEDVADGYNGYRIEPDPDNTADTISQTVVLENCLARHKNATATAPLFYLSNLQEAVLTACKAFGTYEWHGKAPCYPFEFVDCRGIVLNGCSSAFASKHGVKITVLTRPSTGFLIANHTFETIDGAVRADGLAGIGDVIDLCVINPRTEGAVANASGAFDLNRVIRSSIDAGVLTVNIDADSIANIVLSGDTTQVTDAGTATTILGSANQADPRYKIIAGGLRVSNAGTQHLVTANASVQLYSSGAISVQADYPFGPSQVGVLLAVNRGGTVTLSRVEIGEADSGGVGFRILRVAN